MLELYKEAEGIKSFQSKNFNLQVVACSRYGAPYHIRLTFARSKEDITQGIARFADAVRDLTA